ncbi:amphi-Trp domain-containing protein [Natrinema sp. J7-1]|uniref:amphi-Trp domain-containing protein n=1 Tax=Natrinema sp. J7-1 TaxID=1172566 RepID=UPI0006778FB0|nr:amphi-Trp domain-containing protein [Natrinema sp. J7-1]
MSDAPDDTDRLEESAAADGDEFDLERAYARADLAAVFREFATAFEPGRPVRLTGADRTARIAVPERVLAEFEAEYASDAEPPIGELELELEWDDPDGSSVRLSDLDSTPDPAESAAAGGTDEADERDTEADPTAVDPAAAVMPLDVGADHDSGTDGVETDETGVATDEGTDPSDDSGRTSRFEVYEDKAGQWRWRLVHWNGNIVADSGEGYSSRSNAERAARGVMRSAPTASIRRLE